MNNKKQAQHYRKKTVEVTRELRRLQTERDHYIANLHRLNKEYTAELVSYEDYSRYWNSTLTDLRYYEKYIQLLNSRLREYEVELEHLRTTEYNVQVTKLLSFTLITALLLVAGLSHINAPVISGITGLAAAQSNTTTLAEIQVWISIDLSPELKNGITFTTPSENILGSTFNNATDNYNVSDDNKTLLWLTLSNDSNVDIDTCMKALSDMGSETTSYVISAPNLTWSNSTVNSATVPSVDQTTRYSLSYVKAMTGLEPDNKNYYRFWADIPQDTRPADYNNTLVFKAMQTNPGSADCGT